jgi:hypothetical protein
LDTGTKISVSAHAILIAVALFGGQLFDAEEVPPVQVSDVSLISTEEFLALQAPAPQASVVPPTRPADLTTEEEVAILAPEPEAAPAPVAPPQPQAIEPVEEPEPPALDTGVLEEPPTALSLPEDQPGEDSVTPPEPDVAPLPSPRVASENNPEAPTDAEVAKEAETASVESEEAEAPAEETVEKAPEQSSTEIVTEAEQPEETAAPVRSVRPRSRPADLAERPEPEPEPREVVRAEPEPVEPPEPAPAESAEDLIAKQIAADIAAQAAQTSPGSGGEGQSITEQERRGLILAIQDCWSVPVGIQNASELVVTLSVDLAPNGGLSSSPKLIEPAQAEGQIQQAFEAARRALIACAPYDLPKEKYETWKRLEVVFNPKKMVLR